MLISHPNRETAFREILISSTQAPGSPPDDMSPKRRITIPWESLMPPISTPGSTAYNKTLEDRNTIPQPDTYTDIIGREDIPASCPIPVAGGKIPDIVPSPVLPSAEEKLHMLKLNLVPAPVD